MNAERTRVWIVLAFAFGCSALCASARADTPPSEAPDPTRLDVERLPPEAIELTRDMFASGPFLYAEIGGRGMIGGLGRVAQTGVLGRIGGGYELTDWLVLAAAVELSLHNTDAPAPPMPSSFQLVDGLAELRLRWPISVRAALWLAGEAGVDLVPGDLLAVYGIEDANTLGFMYGGTLGFDWHLLSKHHSLGLRAGARRYPNLDGARAELTVGIHAGAALTYVF